MIRPIAFDLARLSIGPRDPTPRGVDRVSAENAFGAVAPLYRNMAAQFRPQLAADYFRSIERLIASL